MSDATIEVLAKNLEHLSQSVRWLRRSYERCLAIGQKSEYADSEFDDFENLTSRFARTTDLVINKVLRSIDAVELLEPGTAIDAANRAEKRGIIESVSELRGLKELRNEIAHEYEAEDLASLFGAVLAAVPELFLTAERIAVYCQRYRP